MPYLEWKDSFLLGVDQFDQHHKYLVELLNQAYDQFTAHSCIPDLDDLAGMLADYATYHFAAEEYWMEVHAYPNLLEHSAQHKMFVLRVNETQQALHDSHEQLSMEVIAFLSDWLVDHILKSDAQYGQFIAQKKLPTT